MPQMCPQSVQFPVQPAFSTLAAPFYFSAISAAAGRLISPTGAALRENFRLLEEFFEFVYVSYFKMTRIFLLFENNDEYTRK